MTTSLTGRIRDITAQANARGLTASLIGTFNNPTELTQLIQQHWPTSLLLPAAQQIASHFTDPRWDYYYPDSPVIETIETVGNQLWFDYYPKVIFERLCQLLIHDPATDDYLIVFQNQPTDPHFNAAIDLDSNSIGTFNEQTDHYQAQAHLDPLTIEMLAREVPNYEQAIGQARQKKIVKTPLKSRV